MAPVRYVLSNLLYRTIKWLMIFLFYFQYAGSKSLPLNYTSMAENFYSQSLSSLSSWGRGLNPDEVMQSISMNFSYVILKLLSCLPDPTTSSKTSASWIFTRFSTKEIVLDGKNNNNKQTYSKWSKSLWKFGFLISELVVDSMSKIP